MNSVLPSPAKASTGGRRASHNLSLLVACPRGGVRRGCSQRDKTLKCAERRQGGTCAMEDAGSTLDENADLYIGGTKEKTREAATGDGEYEDGSLCASETRACHEPQVAADNASAPRHQEQLGTVRACSLSTDDTLVSEDAARFHPGAGFNSLTTNASTRYGPSLIQQNEQLAKEMVSASSTASHRSPQVDDPAIGGFTADFVEAVPDSYKCAVCLAVLRKPVQTGCGHRFCHSCVMKIQSGRHPACPVDRQPMGAVFNDRHCEREIGNLMVFCDSKPSCDWKGMLLHLDDHLQKECKFVTTHCDNFHLGCNVRVQRLSLRQHLETGCRYRRILCHRCGDSVLHFEMKKHEDNICPEATIGCPYGNCKAVMARKLLAEHHATSCQEVEVNCEAGCGEKVRRGEMEFHVTNQSKHLKELYTMVQGSRQEVQQLKLASRNKDTAMEKMQRDMSAMQRRLDEMNGHITEFSAQAELFARYRAEFEATLARRNERSVGADSVAILGHEVSELKTRVQSSVVHTRERMASLESDYKRTIDALDLRVFQLETSSYNGVLVWKFREFSKHLENAQRGLKTSHYSQPFYSSPHGYKACARVYPNGDGAGHGKYLSIFFVIMAGQYDALLTWPFSRRVTLTLMDQSSNRRHISETFMPDTRSTSFQKPTSGMNVASGCPCFVTHELLSSTAHEYLKNDTLYLKIKIDTSGLDNY